MKRVLIILLAVIFLAQPAYARSKPCSNNYTGQKHVDVFISCEYDRFAARGRAVPGSKPYVMGIADCESTDQPWEATGRFAGTYQLGDAEWQSWEPAGFWRWFPDANRDLSGRFSLRYNVLRAFVRARWVERHGGWGWRAWSCG